MQTRNNSPDGSHRGLLMAAAEMFNCGRTAEACEYSRRLLAVQPKCVDALRILALGLVKRGAFEEAESALERALGLCPEDTALLRGLATVKSRGEEHEAALQSARQAVKLDHIDFQNHLAMGDALRAAGDLAAALQSYTEAKRLNPRSFPAVFNAAMAAHLLGDARQAVSLFGKALELQPGFAPILRLLGEALLADGQSREALGYLRQAVTAYPRDPDAWYALGNALRDLDTVGEAIKCYRAALSYRPDFLQATANLGETLVAGGMVDDAVQVYNRALQLQQDSPLVISNLLMALNYSDRIDARQLWEEHRRRAVRLECCLPERSGRIRMSDGPLRIGYVSNDFREHSVSCFLEPVFDNHDPSRVQAIAYSTASESDDVTNRLRARAYAWRDIRSMSDSDAAELIRKDRIDILVDLGGHTASNRLPLFALKPAPIQATWIGYPNTTGLDALDFRITDALADPPGAEALHSERLLRLRGCFLCYRAPRNAPKVRMPDANAAITFGSFNNVAKISDTTIRLWAQLLHRLPEARLMLKSRTMGDAFVRGQLLERFSKAGIDTGRVAVVSYVPSRQEHLGLYGQVHVALDTFPYHGTTTTCEALWMGVPVISMAGNRHASRVGVSLLHAAGLAELVCDCGDAYVERAVALARNSDRLHGLRTGLRQQVAESPLCDGAEFTRSLEEGYRSMRNTSHAAEQVVP